MLMAIWNDSTRNLKKIQKMTKHNIQKINKCPILLNCKTLSFRYAKIYDPDNWVSIDGETAEIRLNKVPDRESKFIVNGSYVAKILCMTQGNVFSI